MERNIIKTVIVTFFAFLLMTSCKKEMKNDGYSISGTVKGLDSGWIKIIKPNIVDRERVGIVLDSAKIENGSFFMKGKIDHIDMLSISINDKYNTMRGFFIENSPISLDINLNEVDKYGQFEPKVTGSKTHDIYVIKEKIDKDLLTQEKYNPLISLREEMNKAYKSKDEALINQVKKKSEGLRELSNSRQEEYQLAKVNYVKNNPNSPVSPYILSFQFSEGRMSKERMKEVYHLFDGEATKTAMYQYFKKTYVEIFETLGEGSRAPDFTLKTIDGKDLTLSKVEGKYILIDFWASWCVPCRASFPHLKELYAKYNKNGFEVIAIGTADEETKWKKAIEEDQTFWNHVFDSAGEKERKGAYGEVAKTYGVPFLPTTFLLDENGVILGRQLRGKDLDTKLEDLFGY